VTWHPDTPIEYRNAIVTGDARTLAERIPDESVDLIFTDPVYERIEDYIWLAKVSNRILRPGAALLTFCGIGWLEETMAALRIGGRRVTWTLPVYQPGQTQRIHPKCFNHWYALLWAGGQPLNTFVDVQVSLMASLNGSHKWRKNPLTLGKYLSAFTERGAVVADFFAGGGTVPAVCKMLGRNFIASEIDPETAERARLRLEQTQVPLFVLEPEQAAMELTA
jgi:DNA modification methylase